MILRRPRAVFLAACTVLAAACHGQVDLTPSVCGSPAYDYCQSNDCPVTGPTSSTAAAVQTWCAGAGVVAPRVTGFGACVEASGHVWATNVRATDGQGAVLFLLYDPASAQLLGISTIAPGDAGADGGGHETDYGTCDVQSGVVTCTDTDYACP
jgi:hypothetical protein